MEVFAVTNILINAEAGDQQAVFEKIASTAQNLGYTNHAAGVLEGLKAREAQGSTGMEAGFAIPHTLCEAVNKAGVIIMRLASDVEWETFDGKPVNFVISLLAPKDASAGHLKLLSSISGMLVHEEIQQKLKDSKSAEEIYRTIAEKLN